MEKYLIESLVTGFKGGEKNDSSEVSFGEKNEEMEEGDVEEEEEEEEDFFELAFENLDVRKNNDFFKIK